MDLELFDIEIGPNDYLFYQKHKDAFKTMWREQGKPFWTRFQITFRSFTVKHGIIKQMNIDTPKFQNLLDQAFIFIHEQFVDGKESSARNFIDDVAKLAQNQDKFPALDSKSFARDPFFTRDTRELFRKFFGPPDQKSSYLKVYILCPVYLRFGGSVCRCLIRWMEAPQMDNPNDDSYWIPPQPAPVEKSTDETVETTMCSACVDDCGTRYFHERIMGTDKGPISLVFWKLGDPRFNDPDNPLFAPHLDPSEDWRATLTVDSFRDFFNYARYKYGSAKDRCTVCQRMKKKNDRFLHVCKASKKKKNMTKDKVELIKDLREVRTRINELEEEDMLDDYQERIHNIIKEKPRVKEALEEAERKDKLEKLHQQQLKEQQVKEVESKKNKQLAITGKKSKKGEKETKIVAAGENKIDSDKKVKDCVDTDMKKDKKTDDTVKCHVQEEEAVDTDETDTVDEKGDNLSNKSGSRMDDNEDVNEKDSDVNSEKETSTGTSKTSKETSVVSSRESSLEKEIREQVSKQQELMLVRARLREIETAIEEKAKENEINDTNACSNGKTEKLDDDDDESDDADDTEDSETKADKVTENSQVVKAEKDNEDCKTDKNGENTVTKKEIYSELEKKDLDLKSHLKEITVDSEENKNETKDKDIKNGEKAKENENSDTAKELDAVKLGENTDISPDSGTGKDSDRDKVKTVKSDDNEKENNARDGGMKKSDTENEKAKTDSDSGAASETVRVNLLSEKDLTANKNIVSGFKVIKIEDQDNGLFEVNVSAACLKTDEEEENYTKKMKDRLKSQELNNFILSASILREKIQGLPERLEWWEGRGFAVAVVNYEEEEKEQTKNWTNFTLKINGYEEVAIKQTLIKLLIYVSKRKRRPCPGWNMEVDDVVACILPEKSPDIEDLSISISRGFRFEDRLTDFEKETLLKHYPNLNLDLVLCGMEKGAAPKTLEKKSGKEKLRKILEAVAEKELYSRDLPVVDVEKLRKKLNNKEEITKADILWEQMIRKPENFEFFVLLKRDFETDWWKNGMRSMDIRLYNKTKNPVKKICPICKIVGEDCDCEKPKLAEPRIVEFVARTDIDMVTVLGEGNGPKIPNMKYTETKLSGGNGEKSDSKKSKASKLAKKKGKRIELSELPAKFQECGIDAEKTMITVPTHDEEPMMGRVPIPLKDKLEKLAPVPGVQSSLNFTFQNGKKEQTITVTLGAYMPEDKINEIQEKKELVKILEEEEKRKAAKAIAPAEKRDKKEKKDKKREKTKSKSPQKTVCKPADPMQEATNRNERLTQITTRFLSEIFDDEEKVSAVTRTLNQHFGVTNKKAIEKKKGGKTHGLHGEGCTCPRPEDLLGMTELTDEERTEKMNDIAEEIMDILDNKRTSRKYREMQNKEFQDMSKKLFDAGPEAIMATKQNVLRKVAELEADDQLKAIAAEKKNKEKAMEASKSVKKTNAIETLKDATETHKDSMKIKALENPNGSKKTCDEDKPPDSKKRKTERDTTEKRVDNTDMKENKGPETEGSSVDKIPDEGEKKVKIKESKEILADNKEAGKLKTCGSCRKMEPTRRAFKKCQKCKDEGVLDVRYYCSKECQVDDWKAKHKMEHKDGLLG